MDKIPTLQTTHMQYYITILLFIGIYLVLKCSL